MVESDPFRSMPVTCSDGINQHQDPGLDEETREVAKRFVRRAIKHCEHRDVFMLDQLLSEAETSRDTRRRNDKWWSFYDERAADLLEEMLSHG